MKTSSIVCVAACGMMGAMIGAMLYPKVSPELCRMMHKGKRCLARKLHEMCL
ncbi:MAG: hypothetical protein J6D00_09540 [Christensenellaceae bacterium]|nr:hypothetical protein [Christensenellaceae bacterium]MBR2223564.1 hypothetical protein [Christensenellaceae bacterium]MBR3842811.1 hypothetical protein [Christensenellaceae bacterium]